LQRRGTLVVRCGISGDVSLQLEGHLHLQKMILSDIGVGPQQQLSRKTPLSKPNRGEGILSRKPRPKRAYDYVGLLYYFVVLLYAICVLPALCDTFPTSVYSLFVLKVL